MLSFNGFCFLLTLISVSFVESFELDDQVSEKCRNRVSVTNCTEMNKCCVDECKTEKDYTVFQCGEHLTRNDWSCVCGASVEKVAKFAVGVLIAIILGSIFLFALCIGGIICCICCCAKKRKHKGVVIAGPAQTPYPRV